MNALIKIGFLMLCIFAVFRLLVHCFRACGYYSAMKFIGYSPTLDKKRFTNMLLVYFWLIIYTVLILYNPWR